jgi:uncharacterized repeat protein (TIGR03847 family)
VARHDFGQATHLSAEAIGPPGQRRFRVCVVGANGDSAALWLEKEQLAALGTAIDAVLGDEGYVHEPLPPDDFPPGAPFPPSPTFDFRLARLSMALEKPTKTMILMASAGMSDEDDDTISFAFGLPQGYELKQQIAAVVAAGRKPCPLCGGPLNPEGHVCARSNGHNPR